uniref:CD109 antigen n=1 Tax=Anopheles epiroticus TaxID=199890 RepID=A0A182PLQ3_9DIPT
MGYSPRLCRSKLGVLRAGSYRLKVLEQAKRTLLNTTELEYIDRSYLVLFQTDKPAYKPGDLVQFRILFLTTDTKPVGQSVQPTIFIIDPERIRMKQWIDVSLTSGVFEGSFRLAEYTSLGRWTITATVNQQLYKDTFSVEEYTLPLFRVQVESVPKPYFQCDEPNMTLKLRATFVHGGSVQGNASVVVRANYNNYPSQTKEVARRELPINGTAVVEFPTDLIARSCVEERNVWFYVTVTESATGVSYSTTCANTVHIAGGVVMEVLDGNEAFYPGSAMRLMVKLATVDKKPLVNQQVVIGYKVLEEDHIDMEEVVPGVLVLQTNANGIVRFAINTTLNTVAVNVEGTFLNLNMFDLEHMVRSSHGNGEENLLFLQTTMAIYDYLLRAKLLAQDTKEKLLSYMDIAYQQLCRYRLDDGSFSMFGDLHECGGVWFTASTIQALQQLSIKVKMFSKGRGMRFDGGERKRSVPDPKDHKDGHYSVVGARILRPNSVYRCVVSTFDVKSPIAFRISIVAKEKPLATEEITLNGNESRLISFTIDSIPEDEYELVAEGLSGLVFKRKVRLDFDNKFCTVLIQTDKSVYKPEDTVRYRVLVLDRCMKPLPAGDSGLMVYIRDGKGNRIKQWSNATLGECGVFEAELTLASEPVLGEWNITVEVFGLKESKTFDVDEYVLPTYEVTVESPGYTFLDDELLKVVVNSRYTYGKPVAGELTVSVKLGSSMCFRRDASDETSICQKVVPIDGKTVVEFNLKEILSSKTYIRELMIEAEVLETLTGRTQKGSTSVSLHEERYKIRMVEESTYFPGLPYNAWIKVSNLDDSPVREGSREIEISLRNHNIDLYKQSATLDDKGMVQLNAKLDELDFDYLNVEVKYCGKSYYVQSISKPRLDQEALMKAHLTEKHHATVEFKLVFENQIQLALSSDELKPGETLDIDVRTEQNSYVGLLAVDQSVLLLKSGNDLSRDEVVQQLEMYESAQNYHGYWDSTNPNECQVLFDKLKRSFLIKELESIKKIVPDTITSWIITGFSLSKTHGLGLVETPSKVNVFMPFFLSIDIPYSVKLGETIRIPVVVFNYMDADQVADVIFYNNDTEFEFVSNENELGDLKEKHREVQTTVSGGGGKTLTFVLKPTKVGHITLKITAKCALAGDGIERQLLVEPEGLPQYINKALLVDLRSVKDVKQTFEVEIPEDAVPDSTKVEVSVIGDVLGSSIENLDSLIRMPFGCGEQNMLNFVPCIVVLDYLHACKRLTVEIETKAKKFMEVGYQRELTYKHQDGSFSAFGESDKSGSTWLTAFVAKSFQQAAKHMTIEVDVIDKALGWLSNVQTTDGAFPEVGTICHKDMQGGAGSGIALTAYTVIAFLENPKLGEKYKATVEKGLSYITDRISDLDDVYAHALAAYALQIANHPLKGEVYTSLLSKSNKERDTQWWSKTIPEPSCSAGWWCRPCSVDVEMSAYGLLATLESSPAGLEGLPIMKWLVSQRNDKGGFESTQDTVVGLQALSKMAAQLSSSPADIALKVIVPNEPEKNLLVNGGNTLVLQKHELPATTRKLEMMASGTGCALFQLSYKYNIKDVDSSPRFTLKPEAKQGKIKSCIELSVSTSFIPKEDQSVSNMAVMEVDMPSGYVVESDTLKHLKQHELVKKVETKRSDTTVVLYFDNIGAEVVSLQMSAFQKHQVENAKPANVIIYDYYDNMFVPGARSEGHYSIVGAKLLRPNSEYHVAVTNQDVSEPIHFSLAITDAGSVIEKQEITLNTGETRLVPFTIGDIPESTYKLVAEGLSGLTFKNETNLEYQQKSFSVFVQTDKSIYKPGDTVRFRVLVLDPNTRPLQKADNVSVHINDAKGNRIKQWKEGKLVKGVFESELTLSTAPVLGAWSINVNVLGSKHNKVFEVDEYVLPKFEVTVESPGITTFKDGKVKAIIRSKYTYGKPVKGEATVSASPEFQFHYVQPFAKDVITRKVVPIDGKGSVEFDLREELRLDGDYSRNIVIEAVVEEELTGRKQNSSAKVMIYDRRYKMELIKSDDNFKPGLPYTAWLKVTYQDGAPVQDQTNPVEIKQSTYDNTMSVKNYTLDQNGMAKLEIDTDVNATYINMVGVYLGQEFYLNGISKFDSDVDSYIRAQVLTEMPLVGKDVLVEVTSTSPMKYFTYQLLGRGDVLLSNTIAVPESRTHSFKFPATFSMVPRAKLVVYYIAPNGDMVSDSKVITFDSELQNFMKVSLSKEQTKPGQDVEISISTNPDSYVGLLGVDQSVLLLKSGNDITKQQVFSELEQYEERSYGFYRRKKRFAWNPHVEHQDFSTVGAFVLSNANDPPRPQIYYMHFHRTGVPGPPMMPMAASAGVMLNSAVSMVGAAGAGGHVQPPPVRKEFPETWLWQTIAPSRFVAQVRVRPHVPNNTLPEVPIYKFHRAPNGTVLYTTIEKPRAQKQHHVLKTNTRPPLAGPFAFSRIPRPHRDIPRLFLSQEVQNTWLFENTYSGFSGEKTLQKKVPDTITSWIITGFSVNPIYGLGLTQQPRKLKVFLPFFVSTNLPYSVKRGEVVAIPIVVFNYMEDDQTAEVILHNDEQEFEFADVENEIVESSKVELFRQKRLDIASNTGKSVSFMVKPKKLGHITIKVTAKTKIAGDAVERQLLVEPEGLPQFINKAAFIDLRAVPEVTKTFEVEIPKNAVQDSTRIEVAVIGDVMGSTIQNLDSLIRMPYGCGEQNMLNFVPNIVVLDYLKATNKLTANIEAKAKKFMEAGYQRELSYKHRDGSFSAFGESDKSGSTWLTAFVARSFKQAANHITIDEGVIDKSLEWLSDHQAPNGSFPEVGVVSHKDMQGGSGSGVALTAYTLIAFLENINLVDKYKNTINKAIDYVYRNTESLDDTYALALAAYALQLADHSSKGLILSKLDTKATTDSDSKWWHKPIPEQEQKNPWYSRPNSVNVEMSAYGMLAFLEAGLDTDALPIMKWLIGQRNDKGGFQSTQDTVVGLQALAKLAAKITSPNTDVTLTAKINENQEKRMSVNADNAMILQKFELPAAARNIEIQATGSGFAVVQLSYKYNMNVTGEWPRFVLDPQVNANSNPDYLHLSVCASFVPSAGQNVSNMAVMEVGFPSGFTADSDTLPSLENMPFIKKVETKDGDTTVVLYFDSLDQRELCPTISAFRTHKVAKQKPAPVVIYDYYDNSRIARQFYDGPKASLCDICENEDCGEACSIRSQKQRSSDGPASRPPPESATMASSSLTVRVSSFTFLLTALLVSMFR